MQVFSAASPSSIADPLAPVLLASAALVLPARMPEARGPNIRLAPARADSRPVVLQVPVVAPVSERVPALARGPVSANVPVLVALRLRPTRNGRSAHLRAAVAVASSSIPKPKKAR